MENCSKILVDVQLDLSSFTFVADLLLWLWYVLNFKFWKFKISIWLLLKKKKEEESLYDSPAHDHWRLYSYRYIVLDNSSSNYVFFLGISFIYEIKIWLNMTFQKKKKTLIFDLACFSLFCVHDMEMLVNFWPFKAFPPSTDTYGRKLVRYKILLILPGFFTFTAASTSAEANRCSKTYHEGANSSCQLGMCFMLSS